MYDVTVTRSEQKTKQKNKMLSVTVSKETMVYVSLPQKKVTITLKYCHYYVRRFEFPKALYKFPVIIVIISKVNRDV